MDRMWTRTQMQTQTRTRISLVVVLTHFGKFCIALALYCYFMFIDPCCVIVILTKVLAGEKESTVMVRGRRRQKIIALL